MGKFEDCQHEWVLHIDADKASGPASGNTVFTCTKCNTLITMLEKNALDGVEAQEKSLEIQERNTRISMWANIIAATTLVIAALVLFFGDKIVQYF